MEIYEQYTAFDMPIPYLEGLSIHPVRMRDYFHFVMASQILVLEKNSVPDVEIISMSYLEYIFHLGVSDVTFLQLLDRLFHISLSLDKEEKISYLRDDGGKPIVIIRGERIDSQKFSVFRDAVLEQNLITPPNEKIDKKLRDAMQEAIALRRKKSGDTASLEDQMVAVTLVTGMKIEDVYDMTIRKFTKTLERADQKMHYQIYLSASMSGFVSFKDKSFVKHWLVRVDKNEFDGLVDYAELDAKISSVNGK